MFTYVTLVVIVTRAGEAGTVCVAISRRRRLGPELSLGVWRDSTLKIYVIRIVHKLLIGIDIFALHNEKTSWNIDHDVNMYTDGPLK